MDFSDPIRDAPLRRGPRPLPLHLNLAFLRSALAAGTIPGTSGWPSWSAGWPISKDGQTEAARIAAALTASGETAERLRAAVLTRLLREDRALIAGIAAYRRHPYRRTLPDPPAVWSEGDTRLLDFGGRGPRVLFVPSLINRATVLDLAPGRSMLRFLAQNGARPLLLDWGWPGPAERRFGLTDYIAGRLERALAAQRTPVVLAGYCMGGLLALAAALRRPDRVRALALIATPWDFHASASGRAAAAAALLPGLEPIMEATGTLPTDLLQTLFAGLDPFGIAQKYRAFARLDPASERAGLFVALEDWLNDGVPLAALLPRVVLHEAAAGHIGMTAGSGAEMALWRPFLDWLAKLGAARRG